MTQNPKTRLKPTKRRELVHEIRQAYQLNELWVCGVGKNHALVESLSEPARSQAELRVRLPDLASTRIRYGYQRLMVMLLREGWHVNTKRVYRLSENTNLLLRQYFPRGTDLSTFSQAQLDQVSLRLNQRPRKTLGFEAPASRLQTSVASTA